MVLRTLSPSRWRTIVIMGAAALMFAISGLRAQQPQQTPPQQPPAGQQPAAQQPAQPAGPTLPMTSDAGLILFTVRAEYDAPDPADATKKIKANGAADFEAYMTKVKDALAKSTKPEYKQMAAGWKLFKGLEGAEPGKILYVAVIDPAVKGVDYDPLKILKEISPTDDATLRPKIIGAVEGVNKLNLQNSIKMGGN